MENHLTLSLEMDILALGSLALSLQLYWVGFACSMKRYSVYNTEFLSQFAQDSGTTGNQMVEIIPQGGEKTNLNAIQPAVVVGPKKEPAGQGYPDMGNGLYSDKLAYKDW